MKTSSLSLNVRAAFAALCLLVSSTTVHSEPQFDVCERQVKSYVIDKLGLTIERIKYWWSLPGGTSNQEEPSEAFVYVEGCSGFHHFEIRADLEECQLPHYGTPPDYLLYRGATKDCETNDS